MVLFIDQSRGYAKAVQLAGMNARLSYWDRTKTYLHIAKWLWLSNIKIEGIFSWESGVNRKKECFK